MAQELKSFAMGVAEEIVCVHAISGYSSFLVCTRFTTVDVFTQLELCAKQVVAYVYCGKACMQTASRIVAV